MMNVGRDGYRVRVDVVVSGVAILMVAGALHGAASTHLGTLTTDPSAGLAAASFTPARATPVPGGSRMVVGGPVATAATVTGTASALTLAKRLPVKGRAPRTGYSRARFGPAWFDADHNGCDTRHDMLRRDLVKRVAKAGTGGCVTASGDLSDPYTGSVLHLRPGRPDGIDVDHVVSLGDAWQTGARSWSAQRRLTFANDPLNLLATSATANRSKGDSDAASWLPPRRSYRCAFVARQTAVKTKYHLWATSAERAALVKVLTGCPTLKAPSGGLPLAPDSSSSGAAPSAGTVTGVVHAGAYCSQHGWFGHTATHLRMRCTTSATDSRYRWRRA
jgi:hypothetical protein